MEAFEIMKIAANALNEKKGMHISAIKIGELSIIAEYMILVTATSSTHVRALSEEVEKKLDEAGVTPHHIEGKATGWILLDYNDVIIHVFSNEAREFYNLDRLWEDGQKLDMTTILDNVQEEE